MLNNAAAPRRATIIPSLQYMLEFSWRETLIECILLLCVKYFSQLRKIYIYKMEEKI